MIKHLPIQEIQCLLHEKDSQCIWCNSELRPIGREYVREEVEFIPAHLKVKKFYRYSYECPSCKKDGEDVIVKAKTPNPVISKSLASPSSVAWLLYQKFELSLPFYRQEKEWQSYGITLNRATMANWVIKSADLWLKPIFNILHQELFKATCIFADETPMQVLHEPGKLATSKSYMWLYRTSANSDKPTVLYEYSPTRSGSNAQQFLSGFSGYLHCDGYDGYNKVQSITRVGCWAHVRRKFHDGISKVAIIKKSQCEIGQDYCDKLFKIERDIVHLIPTEKLKMRKELATPILNQFWYWVEQTNALKNSVLGKALTYAKNQKKYLMNYLLNGECHLSNNLAERSIRPFVVGRKAWNFSSSTKGATSSGIAYSIIQTALENNLNAYDYLKYLFEELPNIPFEEQPEILEGYLPWNNEIQLKFKK